MSGHETHINVVWSESDLAEYKEWFFMPDTIVAVGIFLPFLSEFEAGVPH
jgi:hypothetical protein